MVTIQCGHVVGQRIQHLADVVFLNCCQGFGATSFLYQLGQALLDIGTSHLQLFQSPQ
ncbi:MAG TPA: hypothetical protein PKL18_08535 [Accumulibacter sp.]|nr:hypothetical protein [Accumulibacter sp.]